MSATSHFFNTGELQLHYLQWGEPNGIPVVMLHGLRGFGATWEALAKALGPAYCCYALDQRGRGKSDWGPVEDYHTGTYVADLLSFVDHLELKDFILVGHSLGGTNALEFTRMYPERIKALVIEDIGPGSSNRGDGAARIRREMKETPLRFSSWEEAKNFWQNSRSNLTEDALAARLKYSLCEKDGQICWTHDQQGIAQARLSIEPIDLWPAVKSIECPTLLVKGGDSDFLPTETVKEVMAMNKNFQAVEVAHASHYAHDDQPEVFNQAVCSFISSIQTGK
ncbi:MAG: alpha/beta hydrolase [Methylocystaceae bacterium]|nr:alpha/beta hydrolase [Methylocystaceae bacterium]